MGYYDIPERVRKVTGIDYDLGACLEYNHQPFDLLEIDKVLAVVEGENDGRAWHWIIRLRDGRVAHLTGDCDYTGWDCRSNASSTLHGSVEAALEAAPVEDGYDDDPKRPVRSVLAEQVATTKNRTAADKIDAEFA